MPLSGINSNWFDLVVVVIVGVGIFRGRSRGMSEELLDVLKWLVIIVLGGFAYRPLGQEFAVWVGMAPLTSYLLAYVSIWAFVRLLFGWIKRMVGEKLMGADVFGVGEYYLGMGAGAVRFVCYLIFGLALLNAQYVSPEQLAAARRMQQDNFGDISFPTLGRVQQTVFVGSASGSFAKKYLADQLIVTSAAETSVAKADNIRRQRESAIYDVLGEKK